MLLSELKVKQTAVITKVNQKTTDYDTSDMVASRLETLGFIPGTSIKVVAKGAFGGDPLLIQIGFTRFALRRTEAEKIEICLEGTQA